MPRPKITIEERVGKVYKITSPSGKIYIGSTYQWINARWGKYLNKTCPEQPKLLRSLNKYGAEAHVFEIIWEGNWEEMFKKERFYGEQFNVLGPKGLNCQLPGYDDVPAIISEDTRKKQVEANKGRIKPRLTLEKRNRISEAQRKREPTLNKKIQTVFAKSPILVYDAVGNFIQEFCSNKQASIFTKCSPTSITESCKSGGLVKKGFIFKYKIDYSKCSSEVMQIDPYSDMVIFIWGSAEQASKFLYIPKISINQCANGKTKTSMGFKWKFVDPNFSSSNRIGYKHKRPKKKLPPEFYKEKAKLHYKPINMYTVNGEYIREFTSLKEAAEVIGLKNSAPIVGICKKLKGIAKGYQFRYKVDDSKEPIPPYERKKQGQT